MTAPVSFPTIQAPQLAPRPTSPLEDLPQLLLAIAQHRDAVRQGQAQLELERQRTESQVAEQGAATANSKQDLKDKQQEFDRKKKVMDAHDIVANALPGVLTKPGDFTQNAEAARVALIQQNKQLAPFINDAFNSQMADVSNTRTAIANRRTAEANAPVAEQTAGARISEAKSNAKRAASEARLAATQEETAKIDQHLKQLEVTYGPAVSAMAVAGLNNGAPIGQMYRLIGKKLPDGVDPEWTINKASKSAQLARQADYVSLMADAAPQMEKLYKTVDAKAVSAMVKFPIALNGVGDANTQQYVMHSRDFLAGVLHEESGARLNDAQIAWGIARYIIIGGDSPKTKEAKMVNVRSVLEQRRKNPNYRIPGAPYSEEGQASFTPNATLDVHPSVTDRFTTTKPPK